MIRQTVRLIEGRFANLTTPPTDLVVLSEEVYDDSTLMYQLLWPDGAATWHPRREFEPVGLPQEVEG